eukprot:gene3813-6974_t
MKGDTKYSQKYEYFFHLFGWSVPAILTIIPLIAQTVDDSDGIRCWVKSKYQLVEFFTFYLLMGICAVISFILWSAVIYKTCKMIVNRNISFLESSFLWRHIAFIFFFGMIFFLSFTSRFINLFFPERLFETELLRMFGICGQGFYVFLSFGLTMKNLTSWKTLINKKEKFMGV